MSWGTFVLYQEEPGQLQPASPNVKTNHQAERTKYSEEELSSAILQLLGMTVFPGFGVGDGLAVERLPGCVRLFPLTPLGEDVGEKKDKCFSY